MSKPSKLARLKRGLLKLTESISTRKKALLAKLHNKEPVSTEDEAWLDGDGNPVEEIAVVDVLDEASDYERRLQRMTSHEQSLVNKLLELGDDGKTTGSEQPTATEPTAKKKTSAKRKRPEARTAPDPEKPKKKKKAAAAKENSTLAQRVEILNWHHANGRNQTKTANHWKEIYPSMNLKQYTISRWMDSEMEIRDEYERAGGAAAPMAGSKRRKQTEFPEVDEMLKLWVSKAMSDNVLVTSEVLRQKWTRFADLCKIPKEQRLNLSDGWVSRFKARVGLKGIKRHGEAGSANLDVVAQALRLQLITLPLL